MDETPDEFFRIEQRMLGGDETEVLGLVGSPEVARNIAQDAAMDSTAPGRPFEAENEDDAVVETFRRGMEWRVVKVETGDRDQIPDEVKSLSGDLIAVSCPECDSLEAVPSDWPPDTPLTCSGCWNEFDPTQQFDDNDSDSGDRE